ncbi:hypothetical protein E2C01_011586 [Portunus trituberculatus]|uniref:Uncharacterized protein n=1 Tax=Portunus trituberculatus TaxID=210409 RepID=A0A5B7DBS1_PORTR|nr:hypothetical protein [Portunus trituberculatus]
MSCVVVVPQLQGFPRVNMRDTPKPRGATPLLAPPHGLHLSATGGAPCLACKGLESTSLSRQARAVPRRRLRHIVGLPVTGRCGLLASLRLLVWPPRGSSRCLTDPPLCVFLFLCAAPYLSSLDLALPLRPTRPRYSPVWRHGGFVMCVVFGAALPPVVASGCVLLPLRPRNSGQELAGR